MCAFNYRITVAPSITLTSRELEIVKLVCNGLAIKQVGDKLHIGYSTVSKHRVSAYKKLDVHTTLELYRKAIKMNLIKCPCSRL